MGIELVNVHFGGLRCLQSGYIVDRIGYVIFRNKIDEYLD